MALARTNAPDEEDIKLANKIYSDFEEGNFESSAELIDKLSKKRVDIKIHFNHSVIDYRKQGCVLTDEFLIVLQYTQLLINTKDSSKPMKDPEIDFCVVAYNQALMHFHTRQLSSAIALLHKFMLSFEHIIKFKAYEKVAKMAAYLMMEILLETFKPESCLKLLDWFQSSFPSHKDLSTLTKYRVRCCMMMRMPASKVSNLFALLPNNHSTTMLRAQWELMMGNNVSSLKSLSTITATTTPTPPTSTKGPTSKTTTSSTTSMKSTKPSTSTKHLIQLSNNTALCHFVAGRYHTALSYLSKALTDFKSFNATSDHAASNTATSLSGRPLEHLSCNYHYLLLHNIGVTLLHCGKVSQAFDALLSVVQLYPKNARLWLRLAECSVAVHKQSHEQIKGPYRGVIHDVIGAGVHRKAIVTCPRKPKNQNKFSNAIPMPTMEFASLCVKNALTCLNNINTNSNNNHNTYSSKDCKNMAKLLSDITEEDFRNMYGCLAPSGSAGMAEIESLRKSALALSSYLSLYHHDYHQALHTSTLLLTSPNLPGYYRFLGQTYKARALIGLDKVAECEDLLKAGMIKDVKPFLYKDKALSSSPCSLEECKAVMTFNNAVWCCINKNFSQAEVLLNKSLLKLPQPYPSNVYKLKIYLGVMTEKSKSPSKFDLFDVLK